MPRQDTTALTDKHMLTKMLLTRTSVTV